VVPVRRGRGGRRGAMRQDTEMGRPVFWLLAGANFAVALGYGAILPLLPTMLQSFDRVGSEASVAWHTGALLGIYMLGLFASAPAWGALSDRTGGRRLLGCGLLGYAAALLAFAGADSLAAAYAWRVVAGVAGGAVLPVVNAAIGVVADRRLRARLFAGASVATLGGLLAGPAVSGLVYGAMQRMGDVREMTPAVIGIPLAGAAAFALLVAAGSALWPIDGRATATRRAGTAARAPRIFWRQAFPALAAIFLLLLALCMAVMLAVQGGMFLAPILHRAARGRFIAAGFLVVASGVALLAEVDSLPGAALAVGLIGAGGAFLQPAIAYLATLNDAGASGTLLGALTGAGSLGQALGSFAGGALFAALDASGLWVVAAALTGGALVLGIAARSASGGAVRPSQDGKSRHWRDSSSHARGSE